MSDIRIALKQMNEPSKSIGEMLLEFYETMKQLEKDEHRGGKQATKIVMTMGDIERVFSPGPRIFSQEPKPLPPFVCGVLETLNHLAWKLEDDGDHIKLINKLSGYGPDVTTSHGYKYAFEWNHDEGEFLAIEIEKN